ncbi:jg13296 [Pararge aegeria aegeria]|uniref:Jg13296 protein n=1 Tax=Pararge aegeria aegeria TaxID=348720 RepID=A0A8S4RIE4_9NEOP|nr:jg13296 [Pararge aegeria aegeria]
MRRYIDIPFFCVIGGGKSSNLPDLREDRVMWDFFPLKPPRWPSSAHNWEAPGSPKNAPVPPSYSACRARPGRNIIFPRPHLPRYGYGKLLSYP